METSIPALPSSDPARHGRRRRGFVAGLVLGALGAGLLGFAIGATTPAANAALGAMGRHGFGHDGPPTPEEAREHAEWFVGFALHRLEATPDQEERVQKIVGDAIDDVFPVVTKHHANRDALHEILLAPTIDRAAIEKLRGEEMALADTLSRIVADTVADTAEVLTTGQRTALVEHLARFRHRG
jgi:protein CpxP